MSSEHPTDSTDSKAIIPPNTNTSNQGLSDFQPLPKPPLRPNAPTSFPSPLSSFVSVTTPRVLGGDRSSAPGSGSRQLCVLDTPGLRTPPQGLPSQYMQSPPLNTAPIPHQEEQDYFQGQRPRASTRSRNGLGEASVASPLLATTEYPVSLSSHGSYIASDPHSCTTDSLLSILGESSAPYKARRPSSDSLTMVKRHRRLTEGAKYQRKRRCKGTCTRGKERTTRKVSMDERNRNSLWGLSPTQITPTAPEGIKPPNTRRGTNLPKRRSKSRLMSEPAAPLVSRRWSSVEIGTRQLKLPPLLKRKTADHMYRRDPIFRNEIFKSNPLGERNRSSSFTAGAGYNDIVRSLRERLTIRKLPNNHMLMPSAITLRRPSAINKSNMSSTMAASVVSTTPGTASDMPSFSGRQPTSFENQAQDPESYIITLDDVEAVMELLQANVLGTRGAYSPIHAGHESSVEDQSPRGTRVPSLSFTDKGVIPVSRPTGCGILKYTVQSENSTENSVNGNTPIRNISPNLSSSPTCILNPEPFLQISQRNFGELGRPSETGPARSVHEVIWEEHNPPENSHLTGGDHVNSEDDSSDCTSQPNTPATIIPDHDDAGPSFQLLTNSNQDHRPNKEKGAFDPKNARMSISKWSWQCESEANEDNTNFMTITEQEPPNSHVISFPPLPRKSTNEWRSPLPDITTSIRDPNLLGGILPQSNRNHHSHSLYSMGIDARTAPSSPTLSGMTTTPIMRDSWLSEQAISPPEKVCSWLSNSNAVTPKRQKSDTDLHRKKSVIKVHPKAPARSGNASAIGSAIGSCTGVRRRASSQTLVKPRRVTIFDNPLVESNHSQERKSWFKSIQDIARPRMTIEGEVEEAGIWSTLATRHASKDPAASSTPSPPTSPHCIFRDALSNQLLFINPHYNTRSGISNSYITQPLISPSISETAPGPRSPARDSLFMIRDKYSSFSKTDLKLYIPKSRKGSSAQKSTAYESLLRIHERFPPTPKPDHSGIYDSVTGIKKKDKVECLKDCQKLLHDCDACANMSSPSVDWIG
ncbi:hypothetical protein DSL72_008404 [Monilinia vaccinii-corymbosi]|uniref:Uncharacterized protein n=1 Tax=Monilinia vaccinii-corymbosi TaxID=61207 RepID=A0A8A3PKP6_9HELO|nr:hypothetical protein DSL72_008404 [Monilinia vaccinii-corymbosi]